MGGWGGALQAPLLIPRSSFSLGKEVKWRENGGGGVVLECLGVRRLRVALSHGPFNQRHYFTVEKAASQPT